MQNKVEFSGQQQRYRGEVETIEFTCCDEYRKMSSCCFCCCVGCIVRQTLESYHQCELTMETIAAVTAILALHRREARSKSCRRSLILQLLQKQLHCAKQKSLPGSLFKSPLYRSRMNYWKKQWKTRDVIHAFQVFLDGNFHHQTINLMHQSRIKLCVTASSIFFPRRISILLQNWFSIFQSKSDVRRVYIVKFQFIERRFSIESSEKKWRHKIHQLTLVIRDYNIDVDVQNFFNRNISSFKFTVELDLLQSSEIRRADIMPDEIHQISPLSSGRLSPSRRMIWWEY